MSLWQERAEGERLQRCIPPKRLSVKLEVARRKRAAVGWARAEHESPAAIVTRTPVGWKGRRLDVGSHRLEAQS